MKMIAVALISLFAVLGAACSGSGERGTGANNATTTASPAANTSGGNTTAAGGHSSSADEAPAIVRAALTDAQSITTQHKDIPAAQVAEIEKETGTKIKNTDHHSYLGFSTSGGARRQTGAATLVEANGKQIVIVYESRNGVPYIKDVRADGFPQAFLDQFKGKGHDEKLQIGQDLKAQGLDEATAKAAADAIRQDTRVMQALYGGAHTH